MWWCKVVYVYAHINEDRLFRASSIISINLHVFSGHFRINDQCLLEIGRVLSGLAVGLEIRAYVPFRCMLHPPETNTPLLCTHGQGDQSWNNTLTQVRKFYCNGVSLYEILIALHTHGLIEHPTTYETKSFHLILSYVVKPRLNVRVHH